MLDAVVKNLAVFNRKFGGWVEILVVNFFLNVFVNKWQSPTPFYLISL